MTTAGESGRVGGQQRGVRDAWLDDNNRGKSGMVGLQQQGGVREIWMTTAAESWRVGLQQLWGTEGSGYINRGSGFFVVAHHQL